MTGIDVTEETFPIDVVERSRTTPVVVDFWAEWCGPCRALTPILEAVANRRAGQVVLAKVDIDANPSLAREHQVQSIPAVKGFRDGEAVDEFLGVQPSAVVERFFDKLVPSEADALVVAGDEESLRRALELSPARADAAVPLGRLLRSRGQLDDALELLAPVAGSLQADGLASRIRLEQAAARNGSELAPELPRALAALEEGELERGLSLLIDALPASAGWRDDIRRLVVGELDVLGPEHPLARETRRRLAAALY